MNYQKNSEINHKSIYWIIGGITAIAIIAIGFVAFSESKSQAKVTKYDATSISRPIAFIAFNFTDVGKIKIQDEKIAEFTIENKGDQPLILYNITSSCGCTIGTVTINGQKSPKFTMHVKNDWTGTLLPSEKAIVTLTYNPSSMPVKGDVTRAIYVSTNDPYNKDLTFSIKAFVE
ncbi:MAG: hypothetical protein UR52_C0014G0015 [Candidatus Gottesmanbacteria bacterium GW2011_GWA1_34_13]|uniref:PF07610 family protein n=1 Tax=Candidatus Gottesmanbacteria bacterium GW2011_GWA1_34_13 TaxID=1618434 RepID=A0A0G0B5Y0_9BACT|nr:MAG: hypothetical protein UR52_C0014G0015 [Candidatus Gottesmanbacteria bacterium GW2011_GWA1_34_13]